MTRRSSLLLGVILLVRFVYILMGSGPAIVLKTTEIDVSDARFRDCWYCLGMRVRSRSYDSVISEYVEGKAKGGPVADWRPVVRKRMCGFFRLRFQEYSDPAYSGVPTHMNWLSINWRRANTPRVERERQSREYLRLLQKHSTDRQAGDYVEALSYALITGRVEPGTGPVPGRGASD